MTSLAPELVRAGLRWAAFLVVAAGAMLLICEPGTPEFVISGFMAGAGVVFGVVLVIAARLSGRKP